VSSRTTHSLVDRISGSDIADVCMCVLMQIF